MMNLREGVSITQILFNVPYAQRPAAVLASPLSINSQPRARAPILVTEGVSIPQILFNLGP